MSLVGRVHDQQAKHEEMPSFEVAPPGWRAPPGVPLMFMLRDPDGNNVVVVVEEPSAP